MNFEIDISGGDFWPYITIKSGTLKIDFRCEIPYKEIKESKIPLSGFKEKIEESLKKMGKGEDSTLFIPNIFPGRSPVFVAINEGDGEYRIIPDDSMIFHMTKETMSSFLNKLVEYIGSLSAN